MIEALVALAIQVIPWIISSALLVLSILFIGSGIRDLREVFSKEQKTETT